MNAREFAGLLRDAVVVFDESAGFDESACLRGVDSYDEVGMLTRDAGIVVQFADGTEYQVTVVQTGYADGKDDS